MTKTIGIILIVLGILALIFTGYRYTTKETIIDAGPLEVQAEREKTIDWPPILGIVLLTGGIVLVIVSRDR
jgi:uncharacterized membrane protein YdcZ (DUF606 family)